jgi:nucleotide-binding universal stress UspA family protein
MYKTILLPIDLSEPSSWAKAMPTAKALADSFGAEMHVMTVVPDVRTSMTAQYFPPDIETTIVGEATKALAETVKAELADYKVTSHVAIGRTFREIVAAAKKLDADLIVMSSHRPELTDRLIGATADMVQRNTTASVLIVRD